MRYFHVTNRWLILIPFAVLCAITMSIAQDKPAGNKKWTFEEAKLLAERSPRDAYLQYVVLQTAQREKIGRENLYFLDMANRQLGRREGVDLFNTFSGALAIQESLQLDTMLGGEGNRNVRRFAPLDKVGSKEGVAEPIKPTGPVKVASLQGPTIQSHPWEKMLAGHKSEVGPLASCVPEDYYFIEFGSAAKLMDTLKTTDLWVGHLFAQMLGSSGSQDVERRLKQQLGIQGIPPALLDVVGLKGIAITGSDLYLGDGTDVTLLVQGEKLVQLRQWIDGALGKQSGAKRSVGKYLDFNYSLTSTADRSVHVFAADPRPDLHIRSTSLPAFQKVLAAIAGKNEKSERVKRLGDSTEFAYIRTILPRNANEEDGLVYLSDPFIRRLLGPQVKLTQQHRLRAFNHLKMIERAALMFRTEMGRAPKSFEELAENGCAPGVFGVGKWACPAGGKYLLSEDGMSAHSTVFGRPGQLTPLLEIPLETVSQADADAYKQFLEEYNQYWRTFFDPIAVRIKVNPEQFRLETVVLPLIDNSIYTGMAEMMGGTTFPLGTIPTLPKTIHAVTAHINKAPILKMLPDENGKVSASAITAENNLKQIIIAIHNYHGAYQRLPSRAIRSKDGKPLLSWRVMLLPYLEQDQLYQQFKLDESWDSEHNKKLVSKLPKIYSSSNAELDQQKKTRIMVPVGKDTLFPELDEKITFEKIAAANGTSNTIAIVEAASDKAVVWTKPDDLEIDWKKPLQGLLEPGAQEFMVAACDGAVYRLRSNIDAKSLASFLQWKRSEHSGSLMVFSQPNRRSHDLFSEIPNLNLKLLRQFFDQGIGEELTYQVFDASQPITAEVSGFLGARSPLGEIAPFGFGTEMIAFGLFAQSLTNPVCITMRVNRADIVDRFLEEVDQRLAELPKGFEQFIRTEKYQVKLGDKVVRVFGVKVFGISFRIAWARMGNWLVLTNQPTMLDELASFYGSLPRGDSSNEKRSEGHAQFRINPEAWNLVLPGYRLGWAENHRTACEVNQQQLANLARAYPDLLTQDGTITPALLERVNQIYGTRPYCPDGGSYRILDKGQCECTVHGQVHVNPRQLLSPTENSDTLKSLAHFKGMSATLTFLKDGLHAVVTIERK